MEEVHKEYESRIAVLENVAAHLCRRMRHRDKFILQWITRFGFDLRDQASKFESKLVQFTADSVRKCGDQKFGSEVSTGFEVNGLATSPSRRHDALGSLLDPDESIAMDVPCRVSTSNRYSNSDFFDGNVQFEQRNSSVSYSTSATQTDALMFNDDDVVDEATGVGNDENNCFGIVAGPLSSFRKEATSREQEQEILFARLANRHTEMDELELAAEGFIDDTDFDDECHPELYDVEYEEVTLKRSAGSERLGLTLCYGKGDDVDTDIFVSEIEKNSVAFRDDRIRIGDQILQINGVDVHTRNQAMEQFRRDRNDITLLLARSTMNAGEYSQGAMNGTIVEEGRCCSVVREQSPEEEDGHLTDGTKGSMGSAHEKDSGISRATDSDPELPPPIDSPSKYSQKSSNSGSGTVTTTGTGKDASTPEYFLDFASHLARHSGASRRFADPKEVESEQSSAATPIQANQRSILGNEEAPDSALASNRLENSAFNWRRDSDDGNLERELHYLHQEMEHIQLECDRLIEQHTRSEYQVRAQMEQASRLAATVSNFQKQQENCSSIFGSSEAALSPAVPNLTPASNFIDHGRRERISPRQNSRPIFASGGRCSAKDETSSAYNTGNESCRSTPLKTVGLSADPLPATTSMATIRSDGKRDSAMFTLPPTTPHHLLESRNASFPVATQVPSDSIQKRSIATAVAPVQLSEVTSGIPGAVQPAFYSGDIMYTNSENLQRTILLQQRLLRQAMIQQAQQLRAHSQLQFQQQPSIDVSPFCGIHEQQTTIANWTDNDRLRWLTQQNQGFEQTPGEGEIVKMEWKIKRRSDGSRYLLRRPARNKILKERAEKLSNERCGASTDDDAFSELKVGRYWTREERKKHLERAKERKRRQEELLRRKAESLRQTTEQPILQLSNKKMLRRQGQQLFDKFTTVQEFLAHGSRTVDKAGRTLGILSVTTV